MQRLRCCLGVVAAVVAAGLTTTRAPAAEPASVMIVVDGTGSMAGQVDPKARPPKTKLGAVQDALRGALSNAVPQTRIGLAIFAHRRGSCVDVEIVRPPQPIEQPAEANAMLAPLAAIKPRFKGPLALAVREAAKQLPKDAAARSVVLIHDGPDDCRQDVCAAAAELAAAGVAAHVVSVNVGADDLAKMSCLWQATGGRHFTAETSEQVDAGVAEALRTASGETATMALAPSAGAWAATATIAPPPVPVTGATALHLRALWASNAEVAGLPLQWTVARKDAPDAILFEGSTSNPVVPVTPGEYIVSVRSNLVSASQTVNLRDGRPVAVPIMLGAGLLRARAIAPRTNAPLTDAILTISALDGTPLAVLKATEVATLLAPGRYRIAAEVGLVRAEQTVTVAEGRPTQIDLVLNVGRLQLSAAPREGPSPAEAPLFIIMEDDPPRGRREVARSAASQAEFVLPPGTYYVVTRQGAAEARERLEIGSGDIVRRTLGTSVGRLALSSSGHVPLAGNLISYTVKRLDDPDQETIWTSQATPVLTLPAGRYRIEGRYGLTNVAAARDVDIKAGQAVQLPIEHQTALLRVRLAGMGAGLADVTWEVRDEQGRVVWGSSQTDDSAVLQAGRYVVSADAGQKREQRSVDLRAGDTRVVEIRAE